VNNHKKSGLAGTLGLIVTWAAVLYLLAWLFDSLIRTKWGGFLILTSLATIGWAVPLCYIFYYTTDSDYGGVVLAISTPLGAITALCAMAKDGMIGKPSKRRRR